MHLCILDHVKFEHAKKEHIYRRYIGLAHIYREMCGIGTCQFDRKKPPPPGGFPIYYVPSSRTVCKRTPLEAPGTNPAGGVLLHTVLDAGT